MSTTAAVWLGRARNGNRLLRRWRRFYNKELSWPLWLNSSITNHSNITRRLLWHYPRSLWSTMSKTFNRSSHSRRSRLWRWCQTARPTSSSTLSRPQLLSRPISKTLAATGCWVLALPTISITPRRLSSHLPASLSTSFARRRLPAPPSFWTELALRLRYSSCRMERWYRRPQINPICWPTMADCSSAARQRQPVRKFLVQVRPSGRFLFRFLSHLGDHLVGRRIRVASMESHPHRPMQKRWWLAVKPLRLLRPWPSGRPIRRLSSRVVK